MHKHVLIKFIPVFTWTSTFSPSNNKSAWKNYADEVILTDKNPPDVQKQRQINLSFTHFLISFIWNINLY